MYLTAKQQRFVEEFLVDWNATQAAIRAGYSKKTAYSVGWENLRKPEIQEALQKRKKAITEKTGLTTEKIIERNEEIIRWAMQLVPVLDAAGRPVKHKNEKGETVTLKRMKDPQIAMRANELAGKHTGAWEKDDGDKEMSINFVFDRTVVK